MTKLLICAVAIAGLVAPEVAAAQTAPTQRVTNMDPGVREIDDREVPRLTVDVNALEFAFEEKKSFSAVRDLLKGDGVTSVSADLTVHIYKAHDTVSAKDLVLILSVRGDEIVNHLVWWVD